MDETKVIYQARVNGARTWINRTKDQYEDLLLNHFDDCDVRVLVEYSRNGQRSDPNG